jgi:hypothetical protein
MPIDGHFPIVSSSMLAVGTWPVWFVFFSTTLILDDTFLHPGSSHVCTLPIGACLAPPPACEASKWWSRGSILQDGCFLEWSSPTKISHEHHWSRLSSSLCETRCVSFVLLSSPIWILASYSSY